MRALRLQMKCNAPKQMVSFTKAVKYDENSYTFPSYIAYRVIQNFTIDLFQLTKIHITMENIEIKYNFMEINLNCLPPPKKTRLMSNGMISEKIYVRKINSFV